MDHEPALLFFFSFPSLGPVRVAFACLKHPTAFAGMLGMLGMQVPFLRDFGEPSI